MAKYTVSRTFKTKREAQKWAKSQRKAGYGAQVNQVADGYMVQRTARPIR